MEFHCYWNLSGLETDYFSVFSVFSVLFSRPLCGEQKKKSKGRKERNQKGSVSLGAQFAFFLFHSPLSLSLSLLNLSAWTA